MPRCARLDVPGGFYHLMARGNEKHAIFSDWNDYRNLQERLRRVLAESGEKCLAWCLMPNHFHILLVRGERPLPEFMRRVMTGHAVYFNTRHHRCGHLFQNRYKSILCGRDPYLLELIAYIHLNPLRAGLVKNYGALAAFPWCGHAELLGRTRDGLTDAGMCLGYFGSTAETARLGYEKFLRERVHVYSPGELSRGGYHWRSSAAAGGSAGAPLSDPRILGDSSFVERVLRSADAKDVPCLSISDVLAGVCAGTMLAPSDIKGPSRVRMIVEARAKFCFLAKEAGIGGDVLAAELGRSSSAVSYLAAKGRGLANN